jgi:hypothetical protein
MLMQEKKVLTKLVELETILLRKTEKSTTTTTVTSEMKSLPIGATHGKEKSKKSSKESC